MKLYTKQNGKCKFNEAHSNEWRRIAHNIKSILRTQRSFSHHPYINIYEQTHTFWFANDLSFLYVPAATKHINKIMAPALFICVCACYVRVYTKIRKFVLIRSAHITQIYMCAARIKHAESIEPLAWLPT